MLPCSCCQSIMHINSCHATVTNASFIYMNTWVAMQLLPGIIDVNSWVAMQLLLKHHLYIHKHFSCHAVVPRASFIYIHKHWGCHAAVARHHAYKQLGSHAAVARASCLLICHAAITRHHAYKQLGCHAAVTRALCTNISSLVGLELAYGHGSSSNHNSLVSGVIKQLNDTDFTLQCSQGG